MGEIKLSVIMPVFNVEETISLALDSVLMQQVNFLYEIIVVDDSSTDSTLSILQNYCSKYSQIKIIKHKKNEGNAVSFYDGLSQAQGKYFCVLDGDDYYTVKNKLQKQVDFLDQDKNFEYTAVVHKYLRVDKRGYVADEAVLYNTVSEYKYHHFLQQQFYFHTSAYMYRNIFRGNVPEVFKNTYFRGDNPRTFMHLLYTKGKIKVLNFVGSVYFYSEKGIWSQTSLEEQKKRNLKMLSVLGELFTSHLERDFWAGVITYREKKTAVLVTDLFKPREFFFSKLRAEASEYAFKYKDFIFQSLYKSEFIDSFCESLGFIEAVRHGLIPSNPLLKNENNILIVVSNLTTTGGGVYYEIKDIIEMYSDKQVFLLWTDIDSEDGLNADVCKQLAIYSHLKFLYGKSDPASKLTYLFEQITKINPDKIYHYCGHNNVWGAALVQSVLGKNICVFSFDHGFSLGLDNTSYDVFITKRVMDYEILSGHYGKKVIYIPCWNKDRIGGNYYIPFNKHSKLITACAAARYYKLEGGQEDYVDLVLSLLERTGGKHIHYGAIPQDVLERIYSRMKEKGIDQNSFENIPWADNLIQSMYENLVDVFIEPFPVVSYKITLEVLSAGIPIIIHDSSVRMGITDFIYPNPLKWRNKDDFLSVLTSVSKQDLLKHSGFSRCYYVENHSPEKLKKFFVSEQNFRMPKQILFWDKCLIDIDAISGLFLKVLPMSENQLENNFPKKKRGFWERLKLKNRMVNFICLFLLFMAQIPILDFPFNKKRRRSLLNKLLEYWR